MIRRTLAVLLLTGVLGACGEEERVAAPPPPAELTAEAIGHYCGMNVVEHNGPKAQAWVTGIDQPYWFSSVRDAIAFTMLPEEPDAIAAIWVSDMAKAEDWENPRSWVEARHAHFVIGSNRAASMGHDEAIPFSTSAAAREFAQRHGGRVVTFEQIPRDYILGGDAAPADHDVAALP